MPGPVTAAAAATLASIAAWALLEWAAALGRRLRARADEEGNHDR